MLGFNPISSVAIASATSYFSNLTGVTATGTTGVTEELGAWVPVDDSQIGNWVEIAS